MEETWSPSFPFRTLFGISVGAATMEQALDLVDEAVVQRKPLHIGVVNAAKVVNMRRDPSLRASVLASDVIFADGAAVVWASRLLGRPLPERVTGIDMMHGMLTRGARKGYRVYCLGASREVLEKTMDRIREDYAGIVLVGGRDGYFSESDEAEIANQIRASATDLLFVAITSPKKENFLARWESTMGVPVCHGVGGSFDVMAGKVDRAPESWQRLGLEWLYRVKQEPRRLWRRYLITNSLFCWLVFTEWLRALGRPELGREAERSR